ncbi:MAG: pentapeptide repeat-containing protein [Phycisphaerae bacterium]
MESTIKCGKQLAQHADLGGSRFVDVNLAGAEFDNVNLSGARFNNVNLSDVTIQFAQVGGATFSEVGPPPEQDGRQARQRAASFLNMTLCDSTFRNVDLSDVQIIQCAIEGMRIDGILVTDLLDAYHKQST